MVSVMGRAEGAELLLMMLMATILGGREWDR